MTPRTASHHPRRETLAASTAGPRHRSDLAFAAVAVLLVATLVGLLAALALPAAAHAVSAESFSATHPSTIGVLVSRSTYPTGAPAAVLVHYTRWQDWLGVAPFAAAVGAPVLPIPWAGVPSSTAAELRRLAPEHVYVVGSTASLSATVVANVASLLPAADIERISATDSIALSSRLATKTVEAAGGIAPRRAFVVGSTGSAGALACAGVAGAERSPVFAVSVARVRAVVAAMRSVGVTEVVIVGEAGGRQHLDRDLARRRVRARARPSTTRHDLRSPCARGSQRRRRARKHRMAFGCDGRGELGLGQPPRLNAGGEAPRRSGARGFERGSRLRRQLAVGAKGFDRLGRVRRRLWCTARARQDRGPARVEGTGLLGSQRHAPHPRAHQERPEGRGVVGRSRRGRLRGLAAPLVRVHRAVPDGPAPQRSYHAKRDRREARYDALRRGGRRAYRLEVPVAWRE